MTPIAPAGESPDFGRTYWRSLTTASGDLPTLSPDAMDDATFRLIADNIPTLCWVANGDGYIVWYNRRWHEYCGTTPEQMEGWGWTAVHDPLRLPSVMERWTASIASGEPFEMTFPLRGADGVFRPFLTRVYPVRDEEGAIARWVGMNTEISDQISAEEALEENGYQVMDAGDGPSGLKVLETAPRVDLLITDVGLPGGMNGRQVADAARVQRPDLKVLFLTGYAENAVVGNGHLDPGMQVMTKPFVHAEFINKVRELIAEL